MFIVYDTRRHDNSTLTIHQGLEVVLKEVLLRFADGSTVLADQHRVHVPHAGQRGPLAAVAAHHVTTATTVMLHVK